MNHSTNSFPPRTPLFCLTFLAAVIALAALDARAQTRSAVDPYQKTSFKAARPCVVGNSGEVTALVKNGVELSVNEDWDCDGIADAYDNCVGMPEPSQIDSDGNGIGDACEAAATVKAGVPVNHKPTAKAESRKARAADRRSRSSVRERRSRPDQSKPTNPKVQSGKLTTKRKTKS